MAVLAAASDIQGPRRVVDASSWLPWRPRLVRSVPLSDLPRACACAMFAKRVLGKLPLSPEVFSFSLLLQLSCQFSECAPVKMPYYLR